MESDERLQRDAIAQAWRDHLDGLLTEPMPLWKLATYFEVDRKTMRLILDYIDGAVLIRRLWRIPLAQMPPSYHVERDFSRNNERFRPFRSVSGRLAFRIRANSARLISSCHAVTSPFLRPPVF